jgi:hypothetical protein
METNTPQIGGHSFDFFPFPIRAGIDVFSNPVNSCRNCSSRNFGDSDGYSVCLDCGLEQQRLFKQESTFDANSFNSATNLNYKRCFYLNEILKQWCQCEPSIPKPVINILTKAYKKARASDYKNFRRACFDRAKFHALCRSCTNGPWKREYNLEKTRIPKKIFERYPNYFSAKRGRRPPENFRKYGEKWRTGIALLTGRRRIQPPFALQQYFKEFFKKIERAFESVRHEPTCDGRDKCHKYFKCRKSIISINFIARKMLLSFCGNDKSHPTYKYFKHDWPGPSRERKQMIEQKYWKKICQHCNIKF